MERKNILCHQPPIFFSLWKLDVAVLGSNWVFAESVSNFLLSNESSHGTASFTKGNKSTVLQEHIHQMQMISERNKTAT